MALIRWQPHSVFDLRREIDWVFDSVWRRGSEEEWPQILWNPAMDVEESGEDIVVTAELPGVKQEDVKITMSDNVLTVQGEKKQESETKEKNVHRVERSYGSFSRSIQLPSGVEVDKVSATFKDGVLSLKLPKVEEAKPKQIEIKTK